ncbi:MAG: rRNA maturation RNase YbeY [Lentisphaeria bacterium]|nr:rRNA maturation RNase YbeY [Candidatus Neomarinimicrobiota bacterium]MCF7843078.1 rRNA maturation RNase YbeY [Lentisphaeria bacterium]
MSIMQFEYFNESEAEVPDPEPVQQAVELVFRHEGRSARALSLVMLPNQALRAMKSQHFGINAFTDIIAFNLNDPDEPDIEGELYLSPNQIRQNAVDYDTSYEQEFFRVVIHGCLHLCSYEDTTAEEKTNMRQLEDKYLAELNLL